MDVQISYQKLRDMKKEVVNVFTSYTLISIVCKHSLCTSEYKENAITLRTFYLRTVWLCTLIHCFCYFISVYLRYLET